MDERTFIEDDQHLYQVAIAALGEYAKTVKGGLVDQLNEAIKKFEEKEQAEDERKKAQAGSFAGVKADADIPEIV